MKQKKANIKLKDVCAKIFQSIEFFKIVLQSDNELLELCQKCKKKFRVTDFISEIKHVENYPDFEN